MEKPDFSHVGKKIKLAEEGIAKGFLKWNLKRTGQSLPNDEKLQNNSEQIVEEAHKSVVKHGKSLLGELKQAKEEFMKAYKNEENKKD